ncbi:MAG: helix-turn-helix transcriptional regulator [Bdellovibrio sp.]
MSKNKSTYQDVGNPSASGKPLDSLERISDFFRKMDRPPCVSKNLKKILEDQNLTLQKASKRCKLPRSTIHNALVGREISMKTADKLCKGLNVSISMLVYGVEEKPMANSEHENLLSGIFEIVVRKHVQK